MMYFELREFLVKNRKKRKTKKTRHHGPLRRRERHPRRSIAFCRSVAVLRRDEVIVHSGQFSDFFF